jgi:hypothetical protein
MKNIEDKMLNYCYKLGQRKQNYSFFKKSIFFQILVVLVHIFPNFAQIFPNFPQIWLPIDF